MGQKFETDQEEFWAGSFGDNYIDRNDNDKVLSSNVALFTKMLTRCQNVTSLIEFGSNVGLNLRAIRRLHPEIELDAIEINESAVKQLEKWGGVSKTHHCSILNFHPIRTWDVSLVKGVLIHIDPESLPQVYESIYRASSRYILIAEYYNPTPVEVLYRGHSGKLFKRDFAGEMLDTFPDLRAIDYGFAWHRDPEFPQDDLTWFALEKAK